MHNVHCVRYRQLTHVQLYHGDDKAVIASPVNALYDRIFVAGRAAIDRFARYGADPRRSSGGRPATVAPCARRQAIHDVAEPVVLYAPTWVGGCTRHCLADRRDHRAGTAAQGRR